MRPPTKTTIREIEKITYVDPHSLPNGKYEGSWEGYEIHVMIENAWYLMLAHEATRGYEKAWITIKDGMIGAEVITRICPACQWVGNEEACLDYKHPVGTFLCPQCYEVTEKL